MKLSSPLYVSFATPRYREISVNLAKSCTRFNLDYHIEHIQKEFESWRHTVNWRIQFLLFSLDKQSKDIVWVDADSAICEYPVELDNLYCDFAAVEVDWKKYRPGTDYKELLGGTMFFKNNSESRELLNRWKQLDADMQSPLSQMSLSIVLNSMKDRLLFKRLPDSYCQIFDLMSSQGNPVIEHYQASRKFKCESI